MEWADELLSKMWDECTQCKQRKDPGGEIMIFSEYLGEKRHGTPSEYIYVGNKKKHFPNILMPWLEEGEW